MKSKRTFLGAGAGVLVAVAVWLTLGPSQLGGPVSYVAVSGTSMQPSMHTGDLVIVRKAPSYEVGDVVAYRNPQLNSTVIHRIIRKEDDRYVFQGDNNDFVDTYRAAPEDIVGRRWILIGEAGKIVQLFRSPVGAAVLVMVIAALAMSGSGKKKKRRGGDVHSGLERGAVSGLQARRGLVITGAGTAAILFGGLAAVAFMRSPVGTSLSKVPYSELGTFSYEAVADKGPVYPTGHLTTGQPIYMQLVDDVKFSFRYSFKSTIPHSIDGSGSLVARLSDGNGWTRDFELASKSTFSGDHWKASGSVELGPIRSLVAQIERATGIARDFYTLSIVPRVNVEGTMSGRDFSSEFSPNLAMQVGALEVQVAPTTDPASLEGDALHPSQGGVVLASTPTDAVIGLPGISLEVGKARWIGVAGVASSLLLIALMAFLVEEPAQDEARQIEAKHGKLMIRVRSMTVDAATSVEVESIDLLASLARRFDRAILHQQREDVHRYLVENDGTAYSYECKAAPRLERSEARNQVVDLHAPFDRATG